MKMMLGRVSWAIAVLRKHGTNTNRYINTEVMRLKHSPVIPRESGDCLMETKELPKDEADASLETMAE
jgi:hypothetical protein